MNWKKKGLIFNVKGEYDWNKSHAQCPVVDVIDENIWRIYYSTRNKLGQSQISYVEVEAGNPNNIKYVHNNYLFDFGKPGTFDDSGLMPSCIVNYNGLKYMYYVGWTPKKSVSYQNSIGIAISYDNGKTFKRAFEGSILPPLPNEPYFTGTSYVIIENDLWRMYYLSCTGWNELNGNLEPRYHIKYAESKDGITWERKGLIAIGYKDETEGGIVSASVVKTYEGYKMWYAYRSLFNYRDRIENSYRIGYGTSSNGVNWKRKDDSVGIGLSPEGWDSEMISYPNVIQHNSNFYMFYNGNGFGKTGFGYAILLN